MVFAAAKTAHVSGVLLLAICSHESNNFTMTYSPNDNHSPSYGICQLKYSTALQLGFKGLPVDLMDPRLNSLYAAKYLRYQQERYGEEWCALTSAYNAGSWNESKYPGYPRNLKYVRLVQRRLPEDFKDRLSCGNTEIANREIN